jgi:hypothetical protein
MCPVPAPSENKDQKDIEDHKCAQSNDHTGDSHSAGIHAVANIWGDDKTLGLDCTPEGKAYRDWAFIIFLDIDEAIALFRQLFEYSRLRRSTTTWLIITNIDASTCSTRSSWILPMRRRINLGKAIFCQEELTRQSTVHQGA